MCSKCKKMNILFYFGEVVSSLYILGPVHLPAPPREKYQPPNSNPMQKCHLCLCACIFNLFIVVFSIVVVVVFLA